MNGVAVSGMLSVVPNENSGKIMEQFGKDSPET